MDSTTVIVVVVVILALVYLWYAAIIRRRNKVLEALSGIDVQLKKRSSLIPNILQIARKFMEHEKGLLTEITELREQADQDYDPEDAEAVKGHLALAGELAGKMGGLMVRVEDYPELKSQETMVKAQLTYNEVEAQIAAARRFYNASVTALNNSVQIFPGNLIAGLAGAAVMPFFETDETSRAPVNAADHLG